MNKKAMKNISTVYLEAFEKYQITNTSNLDVTGHIAKLARAAIEEAENLNTAEGQAMSDKEKVAQWMIQHGYATGHGDTIEDLLNELSWQIVDSCATSMKIGINNERKACALLIEQMGIEEYGTLAIAAAVRARGQQ